MARSIEWFKKQSDGIVSFLCYNINVMTGCHFWWRTGSAGPAALQRRGRAGRVRAGACYCCYTRQRFEQQMRQDAVPEVARVPLEELVLTGGVFNSEPAADRLCFV